MTAGVYAMAEFIENKQHGGWAGQLPRQDEGEALKGGQGKRHRQCSQSHKNGKFPGHCCFLPSLVVLLFWSDTCAP